MKAHIQKLILFLGLHFHVTQHKWGRKLFGGKWYQIYTLGIPLTNQIFWSDYEIASCQSITLKTEEYK